MKQIQLLALLVSMAVTPAFGAGLGNTPDGQNTADINNHFAPNQPARTGANGNGGTGEIPGNGNGNGSARLSDQLFLRQSAQMALMEIAAGELALAQSEKAAIQEFAQHLINDHTEQLAQAQLLADELGVNLPDTLSARDQRELDRLASLSGDEFNRAWTRLMITSHSRAFSLHERAADRARHESVRAYARGQLVPLATHLATALELYEYFRATPKGRGRSR